ncbi:MAG: ABC transporter substrate binding protein [Burkholderiaceae bacterium]
MPAIYIFPDYAQAGGFMAYGPGITTMFADGAAYVDKIIRGARAADLPMEQPTGFELVVNLKTAAALGLTPPKSILLQATALIE